MNPASNIYLRVKSMFLAIFVVAISINLFNTIIPIQLQSQSYTSDQIGLAMSLYALGSIGAGLFGSFLVRKVGHIRSFSAMAATLCIVAVSHSYITDIYATGLLRLVAGFCLTSNFITIESWLNTISNKSNRGQVFGVYQIFIAIGFGCGPFLLALSAPEDPRLFGLVAVFLSLALIFMSITSLPTPAVPKKSRPLSLRLIWRYSPSATFGCICAGLIAGASNTFISIYALDRGFEGILLSLVLGSFMLGGLLTQYPVGFLADRFDKRLVAAGLMILGMVTNFIIVLESYLPIPSIVIVIVFLLSGGSGIALFPLAVNQMFDHINERQAMSATSTMQILLGVGAIIGPIVAGFLMSQLGVIWLYWYLIIVHSLLIVFLVVRKLFVRTERLEPAANYQVTMQSTAVSSQMDSVDAK